MFFDILLRKLWDIVELNLLYFVTSIPFFAVTMFVVGILSSPFMNRLLMLQENVIPNTDLVWYDLLFRFFFAFLFMIFLGQGPTTSGYIYILREYGRELPCWGFSDLLEQAKKNFKKSSVLWVIDLFAICLFTVAFTYYFNTGMFVLQGFTLMLLIAYLMLHIYVYQMVVTFELPLKHILKNSLLLALMKLPINLLMMAINLVLYAVVPVVVLLGFSNRILLVLVLLIVYLVLPGITNFTIIFFTDAILDKYVKFEKSTPVDG